MAETRKALLLLGFSLLSIFRFGRVILLAVPFDYAQGPGRRTALQGCSEEIVNRFMVQYI